MLNIHIGAKCDGCYYGRPTNCCVLCYLRLIGAIIKRGLGRKRPE
jgi:hypothetical protein